MRFPRIVAAAGLGFAAACASGTAGTVSAPSGVAPVPGMHGWREEAAPFSVIDTAGRRLEIPFLGGLNAPRPQLIDIDADGDDDLFLQETTDRVMLLERDGTEENGLPRFVLRSRHYGGLNIGEWYRFADLDGDGDLDLLAEQRFSYIRYYRNEGTPREARFVLATDTLRLEDGSPLFSDRQNIPQLADLDCNGLPDLLVGKVDGTASRYEMLPGTSQVPRFRRVTDRFEDILIVAQFGSLHGANTMALADSDGDGDLDLFWGDFFEAGLLRIENTGSCEAFNYRSTPVQFPTATPVLTSGYNAPAFGDLGGEGGLDVAIGVLGGAFNPNRTTIENLIGLMREADGTWVERTRQLVGNIDVGSESIPALVDWDGDGDLDLLLANKIDPADLSTSRAYWFENRGEGREGLRMRGALPAPFTGAYHLAPAFGDLDGDGELDLLLGGWGPRIAWYRNTGRNADGTPRYALVDSAMVTITRGSNTTPALGDLDGDGDLDLVIGEASGALNFYRNEGTRTVPRFVLVSDEWEGIDIGRRSSPHLVDYDGDGDLDLLIGSELDGVILYRNDGTRTVPRFVREGTFRLDAPALAAPAFGDLDGDGRADLILGGVGGGVRFFRR